MHQELALDASFGESLGVGETLRSKEAIQTSAAGISTLFQNRGYLIASDRLSGQQNLFLLSRIVFWRKGSSVPGSRGSDLSCARIPDACVLFAVPPHGFRILSSSLSDCFSISP